jgi:hypothetical protein
LARALLAEHAPVEPFFRSGLQAIRAHFEKKIAMRLGSSPMGSRALRDPVETDDLRFDIATHGALFQESEHHGGST